MRRSFLPLPAGPAQTRICIARSFFSRAAFLCTKRQQGAMCAYVPRYTRPWWQSPSTSQGSTEVLCPLLAPRAELAPRILLPTWVPSSVLPLPPCSSPKDLGTSMGAARRETWASGPGPPVHSSLLQ